MPNDKKKAREKKQHYLPADYDGRCTGTENVDYVNGFPTFGRVKELDKSLPLHSFEMRLPIPNLEGADDFETACQESFGISAADMVSKGLEKLKTDLDELFKSYLFGRVIMDGEGAYSVVAGDYELADGETDVYPEIAHPDMAGDSYDSARHVVAQKAVDEWRYTARASGKSVTVAAFIQKLVATGRVTEDQFTGVETQPELFARLAELGIF